MAFDWERDTVSIDEPAAMKLFERFAKPIAKAEKAREIDGVIDLVCLCSGRMRLHRGDLALDELHLLGSPPLGDASGAQGLTLIVDGDLEVRKAIVQEFRAGFLIVFGSLTARDIATTSELFVTGDLHVKETLYGNCTNYATTVLGKTTAKTIVSAKEHLFSAYGGLEAECIVDVGGDTPNLGDETEGREALVDGVDEGYDEEAVAALLRQGRSLLR